MTVALSQASYQEANETHRHQPRPLKLDERTLERAARLFEVVGDRARLQLLLMLAEGELCVTAIAATTGEGMSTISQRLRLLRTEGLIASRRDGKHIYYRLADQHIAELLSTALNHASEHLLQLNTGADGR